jgi:sterigmatocystin biosynthesis cytochrome P450 monooxygenase
MPPHHPVFGHLLIAQDVMSKLPSKANPQYLPGQVKRRYPDVGPVFYLDMWPFSLPILVVASPLAAYQLTQEHSQPKSDGLRNYMRPSADNNDLVSMEGQMWKDW